MEKRILIVDDEESIRRSLQGILSDEGFSVFQAKTGDEALAMGAEEMPMLVLLDIWMPGMDGIETLKRLKESFPQIQVVMISGHGNIELAVKATKLGAFDFIEKPLSLDKIILTVNHALSIYELEEENRQFRLRAASREELTGNSQTIRQLKEQIRIIAPINSWVLIYGENGTGKEVVARSIFRQSKRVHRSFVEVNCAAIPEELIESELFGHEKGAFTGAISMKRGKFDLAHEGTIFLDEIGDMSLNTQAKILRILQEQKFERVGGAKTIYVNVRVIAATNKDLKKEILEGRFREDLYYRLNVIPLIVPPLRERWEDIPLLINDFIDEFVQNHKRPKKSVSDEAIRDLMNYHWPGNVRELKNAVERMMIMAASEVITFEDIPEEIRGTSRPRTKIPSASKSFKEARDDFESAFIERKLKDFGGNISKTASSIGIERSHLHRKIKELGIDVQRINHL